MTPVDPSESLFPATGGSKPATDLQPEEKLLDGISIAQIRTLLAFVEAKSVTGAATALSIYPSTVSRQLAYVANRVGFGLTRKNRKDTIPTNRAFGLAARLRPLVRELQGFVAENNPKTFWVRFGAGATSLHSLLVPNLARLRGVFATGGAADVREARFHMANVRSHETVARLLDGRVDFGVVRESAIETVRGLESEYIGTVGYCVVMSTRFAEEFGVSTLDQILQKQIPVVTLSGSGEFKRELRGRLEESILNLRLTDELDFFSDVVMAVRSNPVAGIVPITALAHEPDRTLFLPLSLPFFESHEATGKAAYDRNFHFVWNPRFAINKFAGKEAAVNNPAQRLRDSFVTPIVGIFRETIANSVAMIR